MRKIIALTAATALAGGAAVPVAMAATATTAATKSIKVGDNWFVRSSGIPSVSVKKGTTVRWKWNTKAPHNVVGSGAARFSSGKIVKKDTFSRKFNKRGTVRIICVVHPEMKMTLKVK